MLSHLTLQDFAVVSRAELAFGPGMTVVSGETGAGKSLLVDALMWLTGARADAGVVRHGAERAELAAELKGLQVRRMLLKPFTVKGVLASFASLWGEAAIAA